MTRHDAIRQLSLPIPSSWGGARPGSGPKPSGRRVGVPHRLRSVHAARHPVHVTLRADLGCLRDRQLFPAVRDAISSASSASFRVVRFSIQANHVHLLLEAHDSKTLSRGMRGLTIRIALAVNRALGRRGPVWNDRYHRRDLSSPREVRSALVYVLLNWKKHVPGALGVDPCSSGPWFDGWRDRANVSTPEAKSPVVAPRTWLASVGWRLHGLLSTSDAPTSIRCMPARAPRLSPSPQLSPRSRSTFHVPCPACRGSRSECSAASAAHPGSSRTPRPPGRPFRGKYLYGHRLIAAAVRAIPPASASRRG